MALPVFSLLLQLCLEGLRRSNTHKPAWYGESNGICSHGRKSSCALSCRWAWTRVD